MEKQAISESPGHSSVIPSWIVSLALHGTLIVVATICLRGCGGQVGASGDGEPVRIVGIHAKTNSDLTERESDNEAVDPQPSEFAPTSNEDPKPSTSENSAINQLLEIPDTGTPILGIATSPPRTFKSSDPGTLIDSGSAPPAGAPNANAGIIGRGKVPFFGIKDTGTQFVYVLDRSGSMSNHNAIRVAKRELLASLQRLDATQQFQIIFYSNNIVSMQTGTKRDRMLWATDVNRTMASQFIGGIQTDGGTDHLPALRAALKYSPDVIFFLTDADEPRLTAKNLDSIKRLNRGGTRIHCIEFGIGPGLKKVDNFLKKLAQQSDGTYQYRDVSRFGR